MRRLVLVAACCGLILAPGIPGMYAGPLTMAQQARLHPALQSVLLQSPSAHSPLYGLDGVTLIDGKAELIVRTTDGAVLSASGIRVVGSMGRLATVVVSPAELQQLSLLEGISWIEPGSVNYPATDVSVPMTGAPLVHAGFPRGPYAGHGVIVLIYDSGIDWRHRDFCTLDDSTKTRILSIWDQTLTATGGEASPGGSLNYGVEYTRDQINAELDGTSTGFVRETDLTGHGTHVAGIAAGNGAAMGGHFAGMAPGADIVVVKGGDGSFAEARMIDGLVYAEEVATRWGKPVVVNWSIGGQQGPHDGSRSYEEAANQFVLTPGRMVCIAAGNDGEALLHKGGQIATSEDVHIVIPSYTPNAGSDNDRIQFDVWFSNDDPILATVVSPHGITVSRSSGFGTASDASDGTIELVNTTATVNGHRNVTLTIHDVAAASVPAAGTWTVTLSHSNGVSEPYNGWLSARTMSPVIVENGDNAMSVTMPGTSEGAVTVASYVTKWSWPSCTGGQYVYDSNTDRTADRSTFSGEGPTADGRQKPDIAAPGQGIASALSGFLDTAGLSSRIYPGRKEYLIQGTSMASPHVAGAAALLLEANPFLASSDLKALLVQGASADGFTGTVPNYSWGAGKLDVANAIAREAQPGASVTRTSVVFDQLGGSNFITLGGTRKAALRFSTGALGGVLTGAFVATVPDVVHPLRGAGDIQCELYSDLAGTPGTRIGVPVSIPIAHCVPGSLNYFQLCGAGQEVSAGTTYDLVLSLTNPADTVAVCTDQASSAGTSLFSNGGSWGTLANNLRIRPIITTVTGLTGIVGDGIQPVEFSLAQNWPNPCNPSTCISYSIASGKAHGVHGYGGVGVGPARPRQTADGLANDGRSGGEWVRLSVYDLLGREVATLVNGYQTPGEHRVVFNGKGLSSGVYFYRLTAGVMVATKAMILLK